jgi:hypothetical protein
MIRHLTWLLFICFAASVNAQTTMQEKVVKTFYSGFEKHDWNIVKAQLAKDFTFTSPNNDDHISVEKYKEKCWPTNSFFKKVNFIEMTESGNVVFLLVEIITTDNKIVRNVDIYNFNAGKIKSCEVFFGAGSKYPGNTE